MVPWTPFEHQIYRSLKEYSGKKLLLAVSGGVDSMVLLNVMTRLSREFALGVIHLNHGPILDPAQSAYRIRAQSLVHLFCVRKNIPFYLSHSPETLLSEEEMRNFRKKQIFEVKENFAFDYVLYAHHQDDLLETEMLKLVRGTSANNAPMSEDHAGELRPFLKSSKAELTKYALDFGLSWCEDPSNQSNDYLRNWMRNQWLPSLEAQCPGALQSLGRSLSLLRETHAENSTMPENLWSPLGGLSRPVFLTLNRLERQRALASYCYSLGIKNFTQNQILEVLKHLDKKESAHSFNCASMTWSFLQDRIFATEKS